MICPETIRKRILENTSIEQCEYVKNSDNTFSFVFRIDGKRRGGRIRVQYDGNISVEDGERFINRALQTK